MAWDRERGATTSKKERQMTVRLTQGIVEALAARAAHDGADRSEVVRQAIAHALALDAVIDDDRAYDQRPAGG